MSGQVFKLSELPRDIVVYLCQEHLAPAPAIALSLTCRDLFELLSRNIEYLLPLDKPDKAELCELLEKDISHNYYFCAICPSLHPFSVLQGPSCGDTVSALPQHDCRRWRWALKGSYFTLGLHHVRLAVNRHLFGRSSGIPLELFALRNLSWTHPSWLEDWSARIIDGDLFLASTRTFRWYSATDELCTVLHRQVYHLCEHVGLKDVQTLRPRGNIGIAMEYFLDIFGLCRECFMDYTFTAEPATGQVGGKHQWCITINTYHRFPSGRASTFDQQRDDQFRYDTEVTPLFRDEGLLRDIWLGFATETARRGRWVQPTVFSNQKS